LIVEFINQLRDRGMEFKDAIVEASRIRLRPVIMTAFAAVMGSVPLILAEGPGSASRAALGVVIFSGVTFATLFTLFIVPAVYNLMARGTSSPNAIAYRLDELRTEPEPSL
jgi:multidrug efflux pump